MFYDEHRALIRKDREAYGQQWVNHLDRYGVVAYFYELAGIMGRLESLIIDKDDRLGDIPVEVLENTIQDKLVDLGNYASFIHDWIEHRKILREHDATVKELSP